MIKNDLFQFSNFFDFIVNFKFKYLSLKLIILIKK